MNHNQESRLSKKPPVVNSLKPRQYSLFGKKNPKDLNKIPAATLMPENRLGFAPKALVVCSPPHTKQIKPDGSYVTTWERKDGKIITGLYCHDQFGLPHGRVRWFLIWLKTKVTISRKRTVYFKDLKEILEEMYMPTKGDSVEWLKEQIRILHRTNLYYLDPTAGCVGENSAIIEKLNCWVEAESYDPNHRPFFKVGATFFNTPAIPVNVPLLRRETGRSWALHDFLLRVGHRVYRATRRKTEAQIEKLKPIRIKMSDYRLQSAIPEDYADKHLRADLNAYCKAINKIAKKWELYLDDSDVITIKPVHIQTVWTPKIMEELEKLEQAKLAQQNNP